MTRILIILMLWPVVYGLNTTISYGQAALESRVVQLEYARPEVVRDLLKQVKSPAGTVRLLTDSDSLEIADIPGYLASMIALVQELDVARERRMFALNHVKINAVANDIQAELTPSVGRIELDQANNRVLVTDTAGAIEAVERLLVKLDQEKKDVFIEAKIVQVILNDEHVDGVDWEGIVTDYQTTGPFKVGSVLKEDLVTLLEALDTVGAVATMAEPVIESTHDKEVEISIHGIKYYLIPSLTGDRQIRLSIRPQNGDQPVWIPVMADVGTDETIVIGGLLKEETMETTRSVPFLGKLPLLGFAFRNQDQTTRSSEIMVFLTPKFMKEGHEG